MPDSDMVNEFAERGYIIEPFECDDCPHDNEGSEDACRKDVYAKACAAVIITPDYDDDEGY